MDLIVERLGVLRYKGGYVTRSNELMRTALADQLGEAPWFRFGTDRHWHQWTAAVDCVAGELRDAGLLEKALVLNTPWATQTRAGEPLSLRGRSSAEYNEDYKPFYAYMEQSGFTVVAMPEELAVGDDEHKWGPAPYHYVPEAYEWIAAQVRYHAA
ncbi:hypothetical protein GCM10022377_01960 [Zhihengliuella alba]|uniref:Uncharacterized protein n=2 Tax=Zhihengliuella alba TaxID=547018 RepID=A0ABP7CRK0_9MICC